MNEILIIENLLKQGANSRLAFIRNADIESICQTVTALVNGQGGDVLIGIGENKKITGIENSAAFRQVLSNHLHSSIKPGAPFSVTPFDLQGKTILLVSTWSGSNKPYSFDSKIYIRIGALTTMANNESVAELIGERKQASFHWERQTVLGAELEDLDEEELRKTITKYNNDKNDINFSDNISEFLTYLGLYNNGNLTNAAILLFAKSPVRYLPQAKIRITAFNGEKAGATTLYDKQFEGNIFKNIENIWEFLNITFGQSSHIKSIQRTGTSNFPPVALREGLMNAIVHRDYSSVAGILQISLYPDKLQISNTGALPDGISVQDLRKEHFSILRNPDIAQLCYIRGYIEMLGSGTLRMIADCIDKGFEEPDWDVKNNITTLVFPQLSTKHIGMVLYDKSNEGVNEGVNEGEGVNKAINLAIEGVNEGVKRELIKVMEYIKITGGLRTNELANIMGKGISTIERYLKLLKNAGLIEFKGAPKTGGYYFMGENK